MADLPIDRSAYWQAGILVPGRHLWTNRDHLIFIFVLCCIHRESKGTWQYEVVQQTRAEEMNREAEAAVANANAAAATTAAATSSPTATPTAATAELTPATATTPSETKSA